MSLTFRSMAVAVMRQSSATLKNSRRSSILARSLYLDHIVRQQVDLRSATYKSFGGEQGISYSHLPEV